MRSYQQKKWQLLAAGVLMSVCTSCFTAQPAWAAEYKEIRHFWWCGRRSCTFCASFRYIIFGGLLRQHLCLNL